MSFPKKRRRSRHGLTLIETILALTIFGLSMVAIGQLLRIGVFSAERARDITTAQILAESKMNEIATGLLAAGPVNNVPFEFEPEWQYTIEMQQNDLQGLIAVRVTVQRNVEYPDPASTYILNRWMVDPGIDLSVDVEEAAGDTSATDDTSGDTSGDTTGGASGGTTGGLPTGGLPTGGLPTGGLPTGGLPDGFGGAP